MDQSERKVQHEMDQSVSKMVQCEMDQSVRKVQYEMDQSMRKVHMRWIRV
jgi:hypothetical protein